MPRRGGWRRRGQKRFRYEDARGARITDADKLARIEALVIPPAWQDVWISPNAGAKLQATGVDAAGRRQYLYHPDFRAAQEQAKYDGLVRFGELLPGLRAAVAGHVRARATYRAMDARARRDADQPVLVSRGIGDLRAQARGPTASRRCARVMWRYGDRGCASRSVPSTARSCGRPWSTPSSPSAIKELIELPGARACSGSRTRPASGT